MKNIFFTITHAWLILFSYTVTNYAQSPLTNNDQEAQDSIIESSPFICSTFLHEKPLRGGQSRAVANKLLLWEVGQTLRVRFMDGNSIQKNKVKQYAKEWEKYANINFLFVQSGYAEIRISFQGNGHYSYVGSDALNIDQNLHTMSLSYSSNEVDRDVVLHEFGHALGLLHEHQHPESNIQWNIPKVYEFYGQNTDWSKDEIDFNVLKKHDTNTNYTHYCNYDAKSIMHYSFPQNLTLNNFSVGRNARLSNGDKSFIAKIYPLNGIRNTSSCDFCSPSDCSKYNLALEIEGQGSVEVNSSEGSKTTCTSACSYSYQEEQTIQLTAIPRTGYHFVKWKGSTCNNKSTTTCNILINRDLGLTAVFEQISNKELSINLNGKGSVIINDKTVKNTCTSSCSLSFQEKIALELEAKAATGYRFVKWEGDICNNGTNRYCTLTLSRDLSVRALFEPIPIIANYKFNVHIEGMGAIDILTTGEANSCDNNCTFSYSENTTIELRASPTSGYRFIRWEGEACNNSSNSNCRIILSKDVNIQAIFEKINTGNDICNIPSIACGNNYEGITDNITYSGNGLQHCGSGGLGAPNRFYKLKGIDGEVTISLCNPNYDTRIDVYSAPVNTCNTNTQFTCVTGNDDHCDLQFYAAKEYDYFIMVHGSIAGNTSHTGAYSFTVSCEDNTTDNSNCACTNQYDDNICEDFDSYRSNEKIGLQSPCWTTWSNYRSTEDVYINNGYLQITGTNPIDGGVTDIILQLGDKTRGVYDLEFFLFSFNGDQAYYSLLHNFMYNKWAWASEVFFDGKGNGILSVSQNYYPFNYPRDEWIRIKQRIDLDSDQTTLYINEEEVLTWPFSYLSNSRDSGQKKLSAVNFFPLNNSYNFYIDDITLKRVPNNIVGNPELSTDHLSNKVILKTESVLSQILDNDGPSDATQKSMEVFPNPTRDFLNILLDGFDDQIINLQIIDIMGREVYRKLIDNNGAIIEMDISKYLIKGTYIIRLLDSSGTTMAKKVVVE